MVCFRVADRDMGSAGALAWTLFFRSWDGRLTSGMVSIEQCGPRIRRDAFSRDTTTDPGGGEGWGISASQISKACSSTDPGGGRLVASTRKSKPA